MSLSPHFLICEIGMVQSKYPVDVTACNCAFDIPPFATSFCLSTLIGLLSFPVAHIKVNFWNTLKASYLVPWTAGNPREATPGLL